MEILVSVPVVPRGHEFLGRDDGDRRLGVRPGGRRGEAFDFAVLRELRRGPRRGGACRSNESDGDETSGWTIHDVPPRRVVVVYTTTPTDGCRIPGSVARARRRHIFLAICSIERRFA